MLVILEDSCNYLRTVLLECQETSQKPGDNIS